MYLDYRVFYTVQVLTTDKCTLILVARKTLAWYLTVAEVSGVFFLPSDSLYLRCPFQPDRYPFLVPVGVAVPGTAR